MRIRWHLGTAIALAAANAVRPAVAQERVAIDLVTHSAVAIDRPAGAIWPHILDPSTWKQGAKLGHYSGPTGAVGEVFAASEPSDPSKVAFFVENVELERNRRRTIKLIAPGGALIGYATWTLTESDGRTVVSYDVYSETVLEPTQAAAMTEGQRREAERAAHQSNQARFDRELVELKSLVERPRAR